MKSRLPALFPLFLAASLTSCARPDPPPPAGIPAEQASVRLISPSRGNIRRIISLPGSVAPNQQAALSAKIAGYLKTLLVDKGDSVKQGDLLAEIEAPELMADEAKFRADLEVAQLDYKRTGEAQQKAPDLITAQTVDAAKAKYLAAKANLDRAATLLGFCRITAPFSGVITKRLVDPGAFIAAPASGGAAQSSALLVLMDFELVRVQVGIPEAEVSLLRKGLPATIFAEGLPGKSFAGSVTRISSALDESRTMPVEFDIPNPRKELLPGMYATVKIGVEEHQNALLLPVEAVLAERTGSSVFLAEEGKARKIAIKPGFNDGKSVEILGGVGADSQVILIGKLALVNGQPVRAEKP